MFRVQDDFFLVEKKRPDDSLSRDIASKKQQDIKTRKKKSQLNKNTEGVHHTKTIDENRLSIMAYFLSNDNPKKLYELELTDASDDFIEPGEFVDLLRKRVMFKVIR